MMTGIADRQTLQNRRQRAEGLRFLHRNLSVILLWNMPLPVLLWLGFHDSLQVSVFLIWSTAFYLVTVPRYFWSRKLGLTDFSVDCDSAEQPVEELERLLIIPSLFAGMVWGGIGLALFETGGQVQQVTVLTLVYGMCLLSLITAVCSLTSFLAFAVPALTGQALYFFVLNQTFWVAGAMSLILLVLLVYLGKSASNLSRRWLMLKRENLELINSLTAEKERAVLANKSKSRFLASASHDLRQPVHSLTMFAEALRGEVTTRNARELVEHVNTSVNSLDNLLTPLLEVSKLEAGVVEPRKMPISIAPLLERIISELRPQANAKSLQLRTRLLDAHVYTDPILLATVIRNLIQNALDFTHKGGIILSLRYRGDRLLLQIRDTGVGIDKDDLDRVFVEFFQVENHERLQKKGLGLGLTISKKLSDLLDLNLAIKSLPGKGSIFSLELLPIVREKVVPVTAGKEPPQSSLAGKRLLIIDNEESILQGTLSVLHRWHCVVDTADCADRALHLLAQGIRYDAYLCDYQLGGKLNGVELLKAMSNVDGGSTPGILVTGTTDPEFIRSATAAGFVLLHKPVKPAQLRALLSQKVQGRAKVEEA